MAVKVASYMDMGNGSFHCSLTSLITNDKAVVIKIL